MYKSRMDKKPVCEILAPAGSFECMRAAFPAGADAVYAGGAMFGARASAENFADESKLTEAIQYAHIRGKKFYLTVNTLLKNEELDSLYGFLLPLYKAGLDAAIVQDMGVLTAIRRDFPELPVHASTQMNVTGTAFAMELKRLGVTRIVTARELSLKEIREIYTKTGLEIESFVHGALCYSYSGHCLLSSMIGGRSGNRGRCAQPCRLAYQVLENGRAVQGRGENYPLSPKDLCTLEILPDILDAGVYSLKIEGRMKKPEYVYAVTSMYRKYVDMYQQKGREGYHVSGEDIRMLQDIYNRGGFTDGYYKRHNGRELMALEKSNHRGVAAGKIISIGNNITFESSIPLNKGDVLGFDTKKTSPDYTLGEDAAVGKKVTLKNLFQNRETLSRNDLQSMQVFRMRNNALITEILQKIAEPDRQQIEGTAEFFAHKQAKLTLKCRDICITEYGAEVAEAKNRPLLKSEIEEKLRKTGQTDFEFRSLTVHCQENIFLPLKEVNELRRRSFEALTQAIVTSFCREEKGSDEKNNDAEYGTEPSRQEKARILVQISTLEQFEQVKKSDIVTDVALEMAFFSKEQLTGMIGLLAKDTNKQIYFAMPYLLREKEKQELVEYVCAQADFISGYIMRNAETYFTFTENGLLHDENKKKILFDFHFYAYNRQAMAYFQSLKPDAISFPRELNVKELHELHMMNGMLDLYGAVPVMLTAGCVKKNYGKCDRHAGITQLCLKDRTGACLPVANACDYCYNVIYETKPAALFGEAEEIKKLNPLYLRLAFTTEKAEETNLVLKKIKLLTEDIGDYHLNDEYKGHFRRGVI